MMIFSSRWLIVPLLFASGCATMMNSETQIVTVSSTPDKAQVTINGFVVGTTPWMGPVARKSSQTLTLKKEGYQDQSLTLKGETSGWVIGNALLGGLVLGPLFTSTDIGSGAHYSYAPGQYFVQLVPLPQHAEGADGNDGEARIKRYVLMFYGDLAKEAQAGSSERMHALMELLGYDDQKQFITLFKKEFVAAGTPDALAERLLVLRAKGTSAAERPVAAPKTDVPAARKAASDTAAAIIVFAEFDRTIKPHLAGMEFILVKGGCYEMGDVLGGGGSNEKPVHEVCVGDFYISASEVTQRQWAVIMGKNPSSGHVADDLPVTGVSWLSAQEYIRALSGLIGRQLRLPTEAEWEYAARSRGKREKWAGINEDAELADAAWFADNAQGQPQKVGQKRANGLGLHDMSGNVAEWCQDIYNYRYYFDSPKENPVNTTQPYVDYGRTSSTERVVRGGSWNSKSSDVRTTRRTGRDELSGDAMTGLRLVFSAN